MVKSINEEEVNKVLSKDKKVVIDCYATWCGPCKMLSPVMDELSNELEGIKFYKVDVDDAENLSKEYGIMSIPTLLVFEDGKLKEKIIGFKSKEELKKIIH